MNTLIIYFSKSGKTKKAAEKMAEMLGADTFEIKTEKAYPDSYFKTLKAAKVEFDANEHPKLINGTADLSAYDRILLGFPVWFSTCPLAVVSFLESNDLSGKDVYPFCTSGTSGCGKSAKDIAALCPDANVKQGIRANRFDKAKLDKWFEK